MDDQGVSSAVKATYEPQLSQFNCLIIHRLRNAAKEETPAETRRDADTLAMPPLEQQQQQQQQQDSTIKTRLKRKHESVWSERRLESTQSTISLPATAASKTSPDDEAVDDGQCRACFERLEKKTSFTCHVCRGSWHQSCSPTAFESSSSSSYLCAECRHAIGEDDGDEAPLHDRRLLVDKIRRRRLAGRVPAKPQLVGFLAGQASDSERIEYFCGKKRTDLLNVLSLCDQLRPRLLIDILVSVSKKHPDLPMFDDPAWRLNLPRSSKPSPSQNSPRPRPPLVLSSGRGFRKSRGRPRTATKQMIVSAQGPRVDTRMVDGRGGSGGEALSAASPSRVPTSDLSIAVADASLPPTWPRAGQGLYAKLPPEDEDTRFLVDDNDEEAFSHFLVDKFGKQVVVSPCTQPALIKTKKACCC